MGLEDIILDNQNWRMIILHYTIVFLCLSEAKFEKIILSMSFEQISICKYVPKLYKKV